MPHVEMSDLPPDAQERVRRRLQKEDDEKAARQGKRVSLDTPNLSDFLGEDIAGVSVLPKPKGRTPAHVTGRMNKLEQRYATEILNPMLKRGEIALYRFEVIKIRLADSTYYTCDFFVMRWDGLIECHETKGFMRDDANVKLKTAAEMFPFVFKLVKWDTGTQRWLVRTI